ncbi:hypothetical protein BEN47_14015 [Hymenobacter lapidarius]|uniref:HEAT repeat domain-containing protein n=1 Tax=Hymenobacter lapidarius TaxID=1908237 RepID=A0A1G1T507_9BACT|nr:hypothetical protein BEN47_14015 [Hymenobacter lapidarius]
MGWHGGYDANFSVLDRLTPHHRLLAQAELCQALRAQTADPRAVLGLGHLRSRASLPVLHDNLMSFGIYALGAIASIDPAALATDRVLALLSSNKLSEGQLYRLAIGLGTYFTRGQLDPRVPAQLLELVAHQQYLVRYHALAALRRLYHLPDPAAGNGVTITRADISRDTLFGYISTNGRAADFRRAQDLLQTQIQAATSS